MPEDAQNPPLSAPTPAALPPQRTYGRPKPQQGHSLGWLEASFNGARGETALWVAVITQALQDALSRCKKAESQYHKHEATNWLTGNSKDFVAVCLNANMDPDYVRKKAKKALAAPTAWRAQAGTGKRYEERKAYRQRQRDMQQQTTQKDPQIIQGPWPENTPIESTTHE